LELPSDKEYEFRYLVDGSNWETDWKAVSGNPTPWGDEFN